MAEDTELLRCIGGRLDGIELAVRAGTAQIHIVVEKPDGASTKVAYRTATFQYEDGEERRFLVPLLTGAQIRVLRVCGMKAAWISLIEIDQSRLLDEDDVVVVPSLIELKLLVIHARSPMVCITPAGEMHLQIEGRSPTE